MYSCSSFTDVTGGPGNPLRDQRAATHPGCGPRTGYLFCLAGLVERDLYTERLKTACAPITFTRDREGFVLNIHTSLLLLLPLLLSFPQPPPPPNVPKGSDGQCYRHEFWVQSVAGSGWLFQFYQIELDPGAYQESTFP